MESATAITPVILEASIQPLYHYVIDASKDIIPVRYLRPYIELLQSRIGASILPLELSNVYFPIQALYQYVIENLKDIILVRCRYSFFLQSRMETST
jgi:hypothetical protein